MQGDLYIRSEGLFFAEVGADIYMTLETCDTVMCLNRAAFALIENLDGFTDHDAVCAEMARLGAQKKGAIQEAGRAVLRTLGEHGFVRSIKAGAAKGAVCLNSLGDLIAGKRSADAADYTPGIRNVWTELRATGGMLISAGDISVIVPNVTDGPIKTCPAHTCTIPAGLFTPDTIIRWFDKSWEKNFKNYRRFAVGKVSQE
ncbi:MAG: hypothetical protein HYU78_01680 [Rhodocyclales bacterium]|nr:hypothetical protein [Rhodocyclales bacterium]